MAMNPLLLPELRELVMEKNEVEMKSFLERLSPAQTAELIEGLKPEEISWILKILNDPFEAEVFSYFPESVQLDLADGEGRSELAHLVGNMPPDDRTQFLRKLPEKTVENILPFLAQAQRDDIKRLMSFPAGSAGARMTTLYASVPTGMNCGPALEKVRHEAPDKETIYTIYVVDSNSRLVGQVNLKDLLLSKPETPLEKIMRTELATVRGDAPGKDAAELVARYDLLAIPVVDEKNHLLGIVTLDDLVDIMRKEATDEVLGLGGVEPGALDKPYFENSVGLVVQKRVGWLMLLFVAEMFTGTVLRHFDEEISLVLSLSFFIPLLMSSGGNSGAQTVSTIIRSLALREISPKQWKAIFFREASTGFLLGLLLGVAGAGRALMWNPGDYELAATVGLTLVVICTWANAVASMVPLMAVKVGMDPTVLSAPLIATLVDATGLIIYFNVAYFFIAKLHEKEVLITAALKEKIMAIAQGATGEIADQLRAIANHVPDLKIDEETRKKLTDLLSDKSIQISDQIKDQLKGIANTGFEESGHAHEWLFPLIGMLILGAVMFKMSRNNRPKSS